MLIKLALNEDGSLPGEPLAFLDGILWFFVTPVAIVLIVSLLVVASERAKASRTRGVKQDVLTRINE